MLTKLNYIVYTMSFNGYSLGLGLIENVHHLINRERNTTSS